MSDSRFIEMGVPTLLEFSGPDMVRFLNGQLTQDVRKVVGGRLCLPSCVTDAKGKLQFRVWILEKDKGALWIEAPEGNAEDLEARITRYLIADDVEAADLTGRFRLIHWIGPVPNLPDGVFSRDAKRFGVDGTDWWIPAESNLVLPSDALELKGDDLDAFRISNGVPIWGRDLTEGILPPEAGLDATDISYQKGCYIGQEVISRIKSAGKVNKRLVRLEFDADLPLDSLQLVDADGGTAGDLTSISPKAVGMRRLALGYLKRGVEQVFVAVPDGSRHVVQVL